VHDTCPLLIRQIFQASEVIPSNSFLSLHSLFAININLYDFLAIWTVERKDYSISGHSNLTLQPTLGANLLPTLQELVVSVSPAVEAVIPV